MLNLISFTFLFIFKFKGRPVYIELYGHINPDGVYQTTTEDRLERYVLRECEHMIKVKMPKCSEKAGKFISQAFVIIDLNKMSFGFMQKKVKTYNIF